MKNIFSISILLGSVVLIQADNGNQGLKRPILAFRGALNKGTWSVDEDLTYCPKGLKPYSDNELNPSSIKLSVTGLGTWPVEDQRDCKFDILNSNNETLMEATAIFSNEKRYIDVKGIKLENFYIFKGMNNSYTSVYLSQKKNETKIDNYRNNITLNPNEEKKLITVDMDIKNTDFFSFLLHERLQKLKCNGKRCGCDSGICQKNRKNLKIESLTFNKENAILSLDLNPKFNFDDSYTFQISSDAFFKSQLIVDFNVIRVLKSTKSSYSKLDYQDFRMFT